jgi:hypothetical protein
VLPGHLLARHIDDFLTDLGLGEDHAAVGASDDLAPLNFSVPGYK